MNKILTILVGFVWMQQASAVIYGSDDRVEVVEAPKLNSLISPSVAIQLSPVFLKETENLDFEMDFPLISDSSELALCPSERFFGQPTASVSCSGFLVGPDLIMTAGHCIIGLDRQARNSMTPLCENFKWVFDYKYDKNGDLSKTIKKENIFSCSEVLYANFNYQVPKFADRPSNLIQIYGEDIALIRLDRPVGRASLSLNPKIRNGARVSMVGHPNGLPQKATLNGKVKTSNHKHYATADLDSFDGNSGSPVVDENFETLGVLSRTFPTDDYIFVEDKKCALVNRCKPSLQSCLKDDSLPNSKDESYAHIQRLTQEVLDTIGDRSSLIF